MNRRDFLRRSLYLGLALGLPGGAAMAAKSTTRTTCQGFTCQRPFPDIMETMAGPPFMASDNYGGYVIPFKRITRDELIEQYPTK